MSASMDERFEMALIIHDAVFDDAKREDRMTWPSSLNIAVSALIEAGYSKRPTPTKLNDGRRLRVVDMLLAYKGTPRDQLFEYPHRDDDSRDMIRAADQLTTAIINVLSTPDAGETK